eukprot:5200483-Prymnesium_polylepis.1
MLTPPVTGILQVERRCGRSMAELSSSYAQLKYYQRPPSVPRYVVKGNDCRGLPVLVPMDGTRLVG